MNKVTLLLAAALALPTAALAQSAPPTPAVVMPAAPGATPTNRHWDSTRMKADMAKLKAEMAKMKAAHHAARAKILAALTPAHRAYFANLVGQLAVAANPDPKAAIAKLDRVLSASEKSKIIAVQTAMMKSAMAAHHGMMVKRGPGPGMAPGSHPMGRPHGHMHRAPDAGQILFMMTGAGGGMHPPMMMIRIERFRGNGHGPNGHGSHAPMLPGPVTPAPAPTPST